MPWRSKPGHSRNRTRSWGHSPRPAPWESLRGSTPSRPWSAAGEWTPPAQRTDGDDRSPDAIPYGARLRLDPRLDLDALRLPAATRVIAEAVQRYGFIVREQTHYNVQIAAEAPPRDDPRVYRRLLGAFPGAIMRAFPWSRLKVLKLDLRGTGTR